MESPAPLDTSRRGSTNEIGKKNDHPDRRSSIAANTSSPIASPLEQFPMDSQTIFADDQKHARLQLEWNDAICKNMDLPEGYAQVAVLIIKWDEKLDQLNTGPEVIQLETLFRNEFHYKTEIVSLCESSPTHQLRCSVSGFLAKYDNPNNLLIVYYTGHSRWNLESHSLELYAKPDVPYVQWKCADTLLLEETSADTLAILDTCYASNATKGGLHSRRTYQLLAASAWNKLTAAPGVRSFTTALIKSLEECLREGTPFTVWGLMSKINKKEYRRRNPAQHHDILGSHSRQILLAPLNKDKKEREKTEQEVIKRSGVADLVLRFSLGVEDLGNNHIQELTKRLPKVFYAIGLDLRRIELDGLRTNHQQTPRLEASAMVIHLAQRWHRKTREHIESAAHVQCPLPLSDVIVRDVEHSAHPPTTAIEDESVGDESPIPNKAVDVKLKTNLDVGDAREFLTAAVYGIGALSAMNAVAHLVQFLRRQ